MTRRRSLAIVLILFSLPHLGFLKNRIETPKDIFLASIQRALSESKLDQIGEKKKIMFLIGQVKTSPFRFIRNGTEYSGEEAAQHLRMKYGHALSQIQTAKQFILQIASRSMLSGQPYLVVTPNGQRYPASDLLFNELDRLEHIPE
jgi:hypothetical protein